MIDITGIDLVKFAQKVYEYSPPQGLGILHFTQEPLSEEDAKSLIRDNVLDMDYVKGRACKMHVRKDGDRLLISDSWHDHTDRIFDRLLADFGLSRNNPNNEHGCACNCIDCQQERAST